jgi:hypothetical protein
MKALGIAIVIAGAFVFLFEWFLSRSVRINVDRAVAKSLNNPSKQNLRALENPKYGILSRSGIAFKITAPGGRTAELRWDEIEKIRAFKKDLITTDLICLVFERHDNKEGFEINEEMAGYFDLLKALEAHLPEFNLSWMLDTASPAFATNSQVIWKRPALILESASV